MKDMTELEKMKQGLWYDANYDEEIVKKRYQCFDLCHEYNLTKPSCFEQKNKIMEQILGYLPKSLEIVAPFQCDYGKHIQFGEYVFVNYNCYFMDGAKITIGNYVFIGPSCGFYTAKHPLDYQRRNDGLEQALPIVVGDNCWFGANVSVMPGVTIGSGCVIGAGSIVVNDIPDNSVAAGVPARVIKTINQ